MHLEMQMMVLVVLVLNVITELSEDVTRSLQISAWWHYLKMPITNTVYFQGAALIKELVVWAAFRVCQVTSTASLLCLKLLVGKPSCYCWGTMEFVCVNTSLLMGIPGCERCSWTAVLCPPQVVDSTFFLAVSPSHWLAAVITYIKIYFLCRLINLAFF